MTETAAWTHTDVVSRVRRLVAERLDKAASAAGIEQDQLLPGKMLRTRLAARVADGSPPAALVPGCAATELVHTASLCHDDVIDNAFIRRARPTLWKATSLSRAVLVGDLLLCEAVDIVVHSAAVEYLSEFVDKLRRVIEAETEQELILRGRLVDEDTCLRLARDKTGPLFALCAKLSGGADAALGDALDEAGYNIGTAYQLADDLFDLMAGESRAGKTLGTDLARGKFTLPQAAARGAASTRRHIVALCGSALDCLAHWPRQREGLAQFIARDLQPVFRRHDPDLDLCERLGL